MKREFIDQFQGKENVIKITSDSGTVSYLTQIRSFDDETYALGACKLNTIENDKKHVLFLFNSDDEEVGRYYLGKALQGKTPAEIVEIKHNIGFFESWNPESEKWVPCVGVVNNPIKEIASKAVSFDSSSTYNKTENGNGIFKSSSNQERIESQENDLSERERIVRERLKNDIIRPKTNCVKEFAKHVGDDFFDFNEFYKNHVLTLMMLRPGISFMYFSKEDSIKPLWIYDNKKGLYCENDKSVFGASAFIWMMQKYQQKEDFCWVLYFLNGQNMDLWARSLDYTAKDIIADLKRNIPDFKLGNEPERVRPLLQLAWTDLHSILNFIDYCTNNMSKVSHRDIKNLRECSTYEDLANLILSDMNVDRHSINEETNNGSDDYELPF